jgi:hypothetical protein
VIFESVPDGCHVYETAQRWRNISIYLFVYVHGPRLFGSGYPTNNVICVKPHLACLFSMKASNRLLAAVGSMDIWW